MNAAKVNAQSAAQFSAFVTDFCEHMCPEQQANRDFAIDVILERSKRTFDFGATNAVFSWLAE
jgi:hypothetical protein